MVFPTRQILGASVRPYHPPPRNIAAYLFLAFFCSQCCCTNVGHGPIRILFLSLILFLVPHPNYVMLAFVTLAECQQIGVYDDLVGVGHH